MSGFVPAPAPTGTRGSGGCFKWGAISCGGCSCGIVLILVIGLVVLMSREGPQLRKVFQKATAVAQQTVQLKEEMEGIRGALQVYQRETGKWPGDLKALVPAHLPASRLTPPGGGGIAPYVYHRPPAGAPGSFIILETKLTDPMTPMEFKLPIEGEMKTSTRFSYTDPPARPEVGKPEPKVVQPGSTSGKPKHD